MKVEVAETIQSPINHSYHGILINKDKTIWLSCQSGAVCFGTIEDMNEGYPPLIYSYGEWICAFGKQGPFTVFTGSLTISN